MIVDSTTSFMEERLNKLEKLEIAVRRKKSRKTTDDMRKKENLFITRENGHVRDILSPGDDPFTTNQKTKIFSVLFKDVFALFRATVGRTQKIGFKNRN